ncbi:hypothetical protein [Actinocrispum wychmicini]|uniref:hypothetical protein n=1 Tax=Actinocrispum wychmicini TaxID=1213861 RepID=UPI00104DB111|nr:hypothetical protein [Actinocrispum wychmicini]
MTTHPAVLATITLLAATCGAAFFLATWHVGRHYVNRIEAAARRAQRAAATATEALDAIRGENPAWEIYRSHATPDPQVLETRGQHRAAPTVWRPPEEHT